MPLRILLASTGAPGQPFIRTTCPLKKHPGLSAPMRKANSQERLRHDPRPQNAVPHSDKRHTQRSPSTRRLLDPAYALRIYQQGVRFAHVRFELPPLGLMVPPRGPPRSFCCGAGARGGERLQNKAGEVSPDPSYCAREACRRRIRPHTLPRVFHRCCTCKPYLHTAGLESPRRPLRVRRSRGLRELAPPLGSPLSVSAVFRTLFQVPQYSANAIGLLLSCVRTGLFSLLLANSFSWAGTESDARENNEVMRFVVYGATKGTGDGIGSEVAASLVERGHEVMAFCRDPAKTQLQTPFSLEAVDIFTQDGERRIKAAIQDFDPDAIWSACGTGHAQRLWGLSPEQIDEMIEANVRNNIRFCRICAPSCIDGGPHLILTGSIAGSLTGSGASVYSGTKAFLPAFTHGLRSEFAAEGHNAKISLLVLPAVKTIGINVVSNAVEFLGMQPRPMELQIG